MGIKGIKGEPFKKLNLQAKQESEWGPFSEWQSKSSTTLEQREREKGRKVRSDKMPDSQVIFTVRRARTCSAEHCNARGCRIDLESYPGWLVGWQRADGKKEKANQATSTASKSSIVINGHCQVSRDKIKIN